MTPSSISTQFGAEWPGLRCGARTRRGGSCQSPAMKGRRRCRMHGSGGAPSGLRNGRFTDGYFTEEAVALRRAKADAARQAKRRVAILEEMGVLLNLFGDSRQRRRVDERLAALQKRYWSLL